MNNCPCGKDLAQHIADGWTCEELNAEIARAQGCEDVKRHWLMGHAFLGKAAEALLPLDDPDRLMELAILNRGFYRLQDKWYTPNYAFESYDNPKDAILAAAYLKTFHEHVEDTLTPTGVCATLSSKSRKDLIEEP